MKELNKEKMTILMEHSHQYLKYHPLFRMHDFVFQSDPKNRPKNLEEEIAFIHQHKTNSTVIYLYTPQDKKNQTLLKLRNFFLPDITIIPVPLPSNDAETVHLLFLLTNNEHEPYTKNIQSWSTIKQQVINFEIRHSKYKKIQHNNKKVIALGKNATYSLWKESKNKKKKVKKGTLRELLSLIATETENCSSIIVQESINRERFFFHSLEKLEKIDETACIYISAIRHIGV